MTRRVFARRIVDLPDAFRSLDALKSPRQSHRAKSIARTRVFA
jgi:hypothetical protein